MLVLLKSLILVDGWYKNSWKEFEKLEGTDKKYYCFDFYDVSLNFYRVNVEQA